jgi:hypothetical protein
MDNRGAWIADPGILAVRFIHDPEPDHIGVHLDDLPYSE